MVAALRDDAFEADLPGVGEYGGAVAVHVLVEHNPSGRLGQQLLEPVLALLKRPRPPVLAVEFQEVEGVRKACSSQARAVQL